MAISKPGAIPIRQIIPPQLRYFRIDSYTSTGVLDVNSNPVQWTYEVTEMRKSGVGYAAWVVKLSGWSGVADNFLEDANDGTGRQQSGVDHDAVSPDWEMQPIQISSIHPAVFVRVPYGNPDECWLVPFRGEDGSGIFFSGSGQYKVLQLDGNDDPVWDYVRLHA